MKPVLLIVVLLLVGIGTGYFVGSSGALPGARGDRVDTREVLDLRERRVEDLERIQELEAEIADLKRQLAAKSEEEEPYPGDTPEEVEKLLAEVYGENNVDLFLDVIDRLLCMGEKGWPLLRKMIMDIVFKAKFLPSQSDFRVDQLYRFGRIFANREKQLMGFLNYLLLQRDTHPYLKQGAFMGGAFYVGSKAPGSEELTQTMMQLFLENAGGEGMGMPAGMLPGNVGKKMQIFAVAMSGNKEMIPSLRDEYRTTKDKDLQGDIVGALAYLGDPGALPLIQERLDPKQGDFSREIGALGRIGTEEAHATASTFLRQIPDSKRFYRHARDYVRQGGGSSAVLLIRDRVQADPKDPEIANTIGTLRRFPTKESLDTLNLIATSAPDAGIQRRATEAATEVDNRLKGILPE